MLTGWGLVYSFLRTKRFSREGSSAPRAFSKQLRTYVSLVLQRSLIWGAGMELHHLRGKNSCDSADKRSEMESGNPQRGFVTTL